MPRGRLKLDLSNNSINGESLKTLVDSGQSCAANIDFDLSGNNVSFIPSKLLSYLASPAHSCMTVSCTPITATVNLDLSHNPITSIAPDAFSSEQPPANVLIGAAVSRLTIDLSSATRTFQLPPLEFTDVSWKDNSGTLNLTLSGNPTIPLSVVAAVSRAHNRPQHIEVHLAGNGYTALQSGIFRDSLAETIDLSNNAITAVADGAFSYNFNLVSLDLSGNDLSVVTVGFLSALPALQRFTIDNNSLIAIPTINNHIASIDSSAINPLICGTYGPVAENCSCPAGLLLDSSFCGYARCTDPLFTCPHGQTVDLSRCDNAPWSTCVPSAALNPLDIALIAMGAVICVLAICVCLGLAYGRKQESKRQRTVSELELTEQLLGTVQQEKVCLSLSDDRDLKRIAHIHSTFHPLNGCLRPVGTGSGRNCPARESLGYYRERPVVWGGHWMRRARRSFSRIVGVR